MPLPSLEVGTPSSFTTSDNSTYERQINSTWAVTPPNSINSLAISGDGNYIAIGTMEPHNSILLFSYETNVSLWEYQTGGEIEAIAISSKGDFIVAGTTDSNAYLFSKTSNVPLLIYPTNTPVRSIDISNDGQSFAVGTDSAIHSIHYTASTGEINEWTYVPLEENNLSSNPVVSSIALSGNGNSIVAGLTNGPVYYFNASSHHPVWVFTAGSNSVVDITNDGELVVLGTSKPNCNLYVFNSTHHPNPEENYSSYLNCWDTEAPINDVAISANAFVPTFVAVDESGQLFKFFAAPLSEPIFTYTPGFAHLLPSNTFNTVDISQDGNFVAAGGAVGLMGWDGFNNQIDVETEELFNEVIHFGLSKNGSHMIVGGHDTDLGMTSLFTFTNEYWCEECFGDEDSDGDATEDTDDDFPDDVSETTDSDGDGIRDSIDQCDSSSGVVVDDSGCQISLSSSTEELHDGISDGLFYASCCFGLLFFLLMCYFGWHYWDTKQFKWAIIINIMVLIIVIFSWNSIVKLAYNEDHAFQCSDGTIVTYGDSREARGDSNANTLEEFLENPPPEWCDESIIWLDELTDQYSVVFLAILAVIFTIPNAILVYFQKSTSSFRVTLPKRKKSSNLSTPWYKNEDIWLWSFIISIIIFALLPIGPLESNVENIPVNQAVLDFPCDVTAQVEFEGENRTECWKDDDGEPKNANEQYRTGLLYLFGSTIVAVLGFMALLSMSEEVIVFFIGAVIFGLVSIIFALGWIYGTLSLLIYEIFAGNIFYLINLSLFITSIIGFFSSDYPISTNTSGVGISTNNKPKNKTKPHGKGKIDHEQIKRLVRQYSDNKVVLQNYIHNSLPEPKESSLMNAIRHRRSEYQKKLEGKPKSLRSQGSASSLESVSIDNDGEIDIGSYIGLNLYPPSDSRPEEVFGTIIEFDDEGDTVTIEEDGTGDLVTGYQDDMFITDVEMKEYSDVRSQSNNKPVQPKTKIKPLHTDFLNNSSEAEKEKSSKPVISEDGQGVVTRITSFSVVKIDKISQLVEKTPTKDDFNQMFIDEITTMKALDDKNIEVGLIDYELGESPKIVTRYFGSDNLGDVIATANNRGKKILILELIKKVNTIHGAGWVHRDLKPDNIMVDRRPKGDHRFAEIIDYGIAMKVNRRQTEVHNTAGTAFFGHNSQKDTTFNASTGQDWFSLARIFALILRGVTVKSLDAEIQMSQSGLDLSKEIGALGFGEEVEKSLVELIIQATKPSCEQHETIAILARIGKEMNKVL